MRKILASMGAALLPTFALAQTTLQIGNLSTANNVIKFITNLLRFAVPFLISLAIVYFLFAVVNFIRKGAGDEKTRGAAKGTLIYSIVALAVMVSVYGLINFVTSSVGLNNSGVPIPTLPLN